MFKGSVVVVTGGASGIGAALAQELVRRGARVYVTDLDGAGAEACASELPGGAATAHALDVTDADAVSGLVSQVLAEQGRIDMMFNNAGIAVGGEVVDLTLDDWNRALDVNLRGVIHGVVAVYPEMVRQRSGHIVNTASLAGLGPVGLLTPYATTKHAVVGLSLSLRVEAATYGIRVTALCPSAVETPLLDAAAAPGGGRFDGRRFLTKSLGMGRPYPVDALARDVLHGIERNVPLVVTPAKARAIWRLGRVSPALVAKAAERAVRRERAAMSHP